MSMIKENSKSFQWSSNDDLKITSGQNFFSIKFKLTYAKRIAIS